MQSHLLNPGPLQPTYETHRAVQGHIDAGSDPSRPRGAVRQALCAALQRELTEFYGFLAGLEQQLQHPLPGPGALGLVAASKCKSRLHLFGMSRSCTCGWMLMKLPPSSPAGCTDEEVLSAPFLTLRRLLLWTSEPLRRMRLLAALADGTAAADGGALAGRVWGHTKRGDPLARAYASRLLQQVRGWRPATPGALPLLG